jgi:hypothetical protein
MLFKPATRLALLIELSLPVHATIALKADLKMKLHVRDSQGSSWMEFQYSMRRNGNYTRYFSAFA